MRKKGHPKGNHTQKLSKMGIEEYAKRYHRMHPILELFIRDFFSTYLTTSQSEPKINSRQRPCLRISPKIELGILLYRKILKTRMDLSDSSKFSEEQAQSIIDKIPEQLRVDVEFELDPFISALNRTKIYILPMKCLPSGRVTDAKFIIKGKPMSFGLITPTPCFMFLNYMIWGTGNLNAEGMHCGNNFDLSTPEGMALFLHEIYHIYQYCRNPLGMIRSYRKALTDSIQHAGVLFSHRHIYFELEAIAFHKEICTTLSREPWKSKLKIFESYR